MNQTAAAEVVVGVDTHKHVHAAVVISALGIRLGTMTIPTNPKGYRDLAAWACSFGTIRAFGVEGTGSYGAALARFLRGQEHAVIEVNRFDRQLRHQREKSDPIDAEAAARAVLSGQATNLPKSGTSTAATICPTPSRPRCASLASGARLPSSALLRVTVAQSASSGR